ncbi:probable flavohemoglobin [Cephalotrichum gorgonifer]|uniref:nitric oxide dioxygenase n=1 Tax=Cephalotrichum gorgonifer TaxID=2041049 RepID=A0AAE8SV54_9PEZI|nr:probable flavohemoglobin [Cephalotrichum gorgonifer]
MALTYQQSRMVRATIPALKEHGERITSTFYRNMLTAHPELHNIFNDVNLANGRQPRALTAVILRFASDLNDISELIPRLERMCHKHCSLGIRPEHYEIVGKFLIAAFGEVLGPAMTPDVHVAWTKAYWILAKMLIGREEQMYRAFDKSWTDSAGAGGWRKFTVLKKVREAEGVFSFYLAPKDRRPLPGFMPGQYVSARFEMPGMGFSQLRQYALSDAPRAEYYRITVKRDRGMQVRKAGMVMSINPGLVSNLLIDERQRGDEIELSHPAGEIFLDTESPSSAPLVLISAGVGLTPMISMLEYTSEMQPSRPVSFVHGAQSEMPFEQHIRGLKERMPRLSVNVFKSRLADASLVGVDHEYDARVDLAAVGVQDLHLDHGAAEYYICGPEQFMVEMSDYLVLKGVSMSRVKFSPFSTGELEVKETK